MVIFPQLALMVYIIYHIRAHYSKGNILALKRSSRIYQLCLLTNVKESQMVYFCLCVCVCVCIWAYGCTIWLQSDHMVQNLQRQTIWVTIYCLDMGPDSIWSDSLNIVWTCVRFSLHNTQSGQDSYWVVV